MAVTVDDKLLAPFSRFTLYNSPYPAHDEGCAIDCYPEPPGSERTTVAPSPVGGVVRETLTVRAPPKPYAPECDHLIVVDCDSPRAVAGNLARILHVDPGVEAGDRIEPGDDLGTLVRAGFFAPWVDNHLHLGFRKPDQDPRRASGSLPLALDVPILPLEWDGTGTVVERGETYVVLDRPTHPAPGETFAGIAADEGGVLDGGLPHYERGGVLPDRPGAPARGNGGTVERKHEVTDIDEADTAAVDGSDSDRRGPSQWAVTLDGVRLGRRRGRTVTWDDVVVTANGTEITGLSLYCALDAQFGAKLICPETSFAIGETVAVRIRPTSTVVRTEDGRTS